MAPVQRRRRMLGKVPGDREGHMRQTVLRVVGGRQRAGRPRQHRRDRHQQIVVAQHRLVDGGAHAHDVGQGLHHLRATEAGGTAPGPVDHEARQANPLMLAHRLQIPMGTGLQQHLHALEHFRIQEAVDHLDTGPSRLQRSGRFLHRQADGRIHRRPHPHVGQHRDGQRLRTHPVHPHPVLRALGRQAGKVTVIGTGQDVHHRCRIMHAAGDRARHTSHGRCSQRHPALRGLEAEDAAEGRRHAQRPDPVDGHMQRCIARRTGHRGPGRRTTGGQRRLPWVSHQTPLDAATGHHGIVRGHHRLAQHHAAGFQQPRHHRRDALHLVGIRRQ